MHFIRIHCFTFLQKSCWRRCWETKTWDLQRIRSRSKFNRLCKGQPQPKGSSFCKWFCELQARNWWKWREGVQWTHRSDEYFENWSIFRDVLCESRRWNYRKICQRINEFKASQIENAIKLKKKINWKLEITCCFHSWKIKNSIFDLKERKTNTIFNSMTMASPLIYSYVSIFSFEKFPSISITSTKNYNIIMTYFLTPNDFSLPVFILLFFTHFFQCLLALNNCDKTFKMLLDSVE